MEKGYHSMRKFVIFFCLAFSSCGGTAIFTSAGTSLANPLTIAVDSTTARAYVVNSNNKVLYSSGSMHVVNIATPASPARVNSVSLDSFGGQVYVDTTRLVAWVPNRLSDNVEDKTDHLVRVDVNEAAGTFLGTSQSDAGGDPFGTAFFAANNWLLVASREGIINYYDITSSAPTAQSVDLKRSLSDGGSLTKADVTDIVVIGNQAVLSRASGGLLVVNLSELANSSANPVDYYISDLSSPRGLATDGTNIYVANVETDADNNKTNSLLVLNLASLTADTGNTTTAVRDKDDNGLLAATISVGNNPQQVVAGTTEGFVANMDDDTVTVFTLASRAVAATVTVGDEPFGMALYSPAGVNTHLLVCNIQSNTVSVVDLATRSIVATYQ